MPHITKPPFPALLGEPAGFGQTLRPDRCGRRLWPAPGSLGHRPRKGAGRPPESPSGSAQLSPFTACKAQRRGPGLRETNWAPWGLGRRRRNRRTTRPKGRLPVQLSPCGRRRQKVLCDVAPEPLLPQRPWEAPTFDRGFSSETSLIKLV